ncbi:MAG: hypothetical protein AAF497_19275, partial [Planctomycetota bacterium]
LLINLRQRAQLQKQFETLGESMMTTSIGKRSVRNWIRCGLLAVAFSNCAIAQNFSWTDTNPTGFYENSNNWTPSGVPDSDTATAIFGLPQQHFVGMLSSKQLGNLTVANNADVHFSPAGMDPPDGTLSVSGLTDINRATLSVGALGVSTSNTNLIGNEFKIDGNMNVTKGARVIGTTARFSTEPNLDSRVVVAGNPEDTAAAASQFIFSDIHVGERGDAALEVIDGARAISTNLRIAENDGSESSLMVWGMTPGGSRSFMATNLEFGNGIAQVDVAQGAEMFTGGVVMGPSSTSRSTVSVAGTELGTRASWDVDGPLTVGMGGRGALFVHHGGELKTRGAEVAVLPGSNSEVKVHSLLGGQNAVWYNSGDLAIGGSQHFQGGNAQIEVSYGGSLQSFGKVTLWNSGQLHLRGGRITADWIDHSHNGNLLLQSGTLVADLVLGSFTNVGATLYVDRVEGSLTNEAGVVDPGRVIGEMLITGDYIQQQDATASFVIGGNVDGSYDVLDVAGNAILDGALSVGVQPAFTPDAADEFRIMNVGVRDGFFNNLTPSNRLIVRSGRGAFQVNYEPNGVVLSDYMDLTVVDFDQNGSVDCVDVNALTREIAAGSNSTDFDLNGDGSVNTDDLDQWLADAGAINLPSGGAFPMGDANLDGTVDVSDFNIWNRHKFSEADRWCSADFNADGIVDVADFNLWNANKFTSADAAVSSVPEPQLGLISVFAMLGIVMLSRKR